MSLKPAKSWSAKVPLILEDAEQPLTTVARGFIHRLYRELVDHEKQIGEIEKKLFALVEQNDDCQRLLFIPGIGPVVASTLLASVGNAHYFKNGRQMAAWSSLDEGNETSLRVTVTIAEYLGVISKTRPISHQAGQIYVDTQ
jgi:transposase